MRIQTSGMLLLANVYIRALSFSLALDRISEELRTETLNDQGGDDGGLPVPSSVDN